MNRLNRLLKKLQAVMQEPAGACCLKGKCYDSYTLSDCTGRFGEFHAGKSCQEVNCLQPKPGTQKTNNKTL